MAISGTRKSIGTKRTVLAKSDGRSNTGSPRNGLRYPRFYICIDDGYDDISLKVGKVYAVIKPEPSDRPNDLRVIDEEGEDYLYPAKSFVPVELPPRARRAVVGAAER